MEKDFVDALGPAFTAHRLRRLSELILEGTGPFIRANGFIAPPRSGSTLLLLAAEGESSITELAHRLRLSHPFIVKLATTLVELHLVEELRDPRDQRRRLIRLTAKGQEQVSRLQRLLGVVAETFDDLSAEIGVDLQIVLQKFEAALERRSLSKRLESQFTHQGEG